MSALAARGRLLAPAVAPSSSGRAPLPLPALPLPVPALRGRRPPRCPPARALGPVLAPGGGAPAASLAGAAREAVGAVAGLDAGTAGVVKAVAAPVFTVLTMLMIVRIVMTWYPEIDGKKFPWSLAYEPTEPLLSGTRKVIPPLSGVDISPIVWVGLISFANEIFLGPQGLLSMVERQGGL